ncbi:glycosyltransferase family 2 protein, partial [Paenarthrobacter aurescens]|uniref:glycosyltransferase family 2 protein n=2 Tax=Bacteria TaxID=2 RepID=UPI0021C04493
MPVHNAESYLSEVITSILQQTYPDFELIVINDNSDDNTLNLINDFAREDQRIKVICNENNL